MANIRALHIIPTVAPRYGGTSTVIWPLIAALRTAGFDVELATTDADGPGGRLTKADLPADAGAVHLFTARRYPREMARWLRANVRNYDLVHVHTLWNAVAVIGSRAARQAGVPYICSPHGMLSAYSWARSSRKKRVFWWALARADVRGAAAVHATSPGEADEVRHVCRGGRIVMAPLGLADGAWQPRRPNWLREQCQGSVRGRPLILFLSRLHSKKGIIDFLLPAFRPLASRAFLVIAGGPDESEPRHPAAIRQEIERLALTADISLHGPISPSDRWSAFDGADLFVLPSQQENFGLVVTEAMARGCPVVVSKEALASEHVQAAGAGRVVPLNVPDLSAALAEMLAEPALRAEMGDRGRAYTAEHLRWDRVIGPLVDVYRQCGRRPAVPAPMMGPLESKRIISSSPSVSKP